MSGWGNLPRKKRFFRGDKPRRSITALVSLTHYQDKTIKDSHGEFTGRVIDGEPHGFGRLLTPCGSVYTGSWKGIQYFTGSVVYKDGATYNGGVRFGKRHGKGIIIKPNGDEYDGDFSNGAFHGEGVIRRANGDVHKGSFSNDRLHGRVIASYASGNKLEGEFINGKPVGVIVITRPDGTVDKKCFN